MSIQMYVCMFYVVPSPCNFLAWIVSMFISGLSLHIALKRGSVLALPPWHFLGPFLALPWHFFGTSLVLPGQFLGTSLALHWYFLGTSLALPHHFLGTSRALSQRFIVLKRHFKGAYSHKTYYITIFQEILNLKGNQNRGTGLKVMAICLNG